MQRFSIGSTDGSRRQVGTNFRKIRQRCGASPRTRTQRRKKSHDFFSVSRRKILFMQIYQPMPLPLDETQVIASNEPVETLVAVQVAAPDQRILEEKKSAENATETVFASPGRQRHFTLPSWPTSQPGPGVTALSPGQRLVSIRTDQVTYDCYDQERGRPGLPPPALAEGRTKHPDLQHT